MIKLCHGSRVRISNKILYNLVINPTSNRRVGLKHIGI